MQICVTCNQYREDVSLDEITINGLSSKKTISPDNFR